jgi:tetratricopeptide (TPR) repeat protein
MQVGSLYAQTPYEFRMNIPRSRYPRIRVLLLLLVASAAALIVVRSTLRPVILQPPPSASVSEKMRYYKARIDTDPSDGAAYVELGKLEESQEFFNSALRRLYKARALGASEKEVLLPLGRALSNLGRWDEAKAELTKATALMPDSVEAVANLSGAYYASGDAGEASRVLREFVEKHRSPDKRIRLPLNDLHRIMLCFSEARDTEMASRVAWEIVRVSPKDAGGYAIVGNALLVKDRYREALPYLEEAVSLEPGVASLCYNYAIALAHCGRDKEALKQLQRCVVLNPNATDAFLELGSLYEKRKDWKSAATALSNAAVNANDDPRVLYRAAKINERAGNVDEANYWFSMAGLAAGEPDEALVYARKLISSKQPTWRITGLLNAAEAYHSLHRMKDYLETMKQAASKDTAEDYLRLAGAYQKADLLEKQIEYLRKAMEKEPKLGPEAHYAIAKTLLLRGRRDDAENELEQAVAGDPQNAQYHTLLGTVYFERRRNGDRLKKAIDEYKEAVRLNPKDASGYQSLGIAYSAAGDYDRAALYLEHAIDLQPGYGPSYQELGRVYAKMGDKQASEKMLALYSKYVRHDLRLKTLLAKADQNKGDATAQRELGDMQARSGDYASALESYAAALKLKPADAATQRKYDRLLDLLALRDASKTSKR